MARVDITLADEVKRYASLHRQPISVVIRDALMLLMEEYPCAGDHSGPQRLAAHEFLSDRYESPLDMLIGETDSAAVEAFLSDIKEAVVDNILSETNRDAVYTSDIKEDMADMTSDRNTESRAAPTKTPESARSLKVSDRKAAQTVSHATSTADASSIASDAKAARADGPTRKGGRPRSNLGQRILALLAEHPEGLTADELRVYLKAERPIGDTLQGMKRKGVMQTQGQGKAVRYMLP